MNKRIVTMNEFYQIIKNWLLDIISSGLPLDYDINILRKFILINLFAILSGVFLFILSIIGLFQNYFILSIADMTCFLITIFSVYILRKKKNYAFIGLFALIVAGLFFLFLVAFIGVEKSAFLWILTYPIAALFILGKRTGSFLSAIVLLMTCILFFLGEHSTILQSYDVDIIIRLIGVYITLYLIALATEFVRENVHNTLVSEISNRKKAERKLRNSQNFLDNVIESIQDGISVLNTDLTIRHTNSVMEKWYKNSSPLTGKKCYECYLNKQTFCDPCPSLRCMKSGKTESEIVQGLPGSPVEWLEVFSFPIKENDSGKITGAVEYVRDITIRKRLEDQLSRSQKMEAIGILAGGIAHDLNNILTSIVTYPDLIFLDLPDDSPIRAPLETIQISGEKAAAIVKDMLTLAKGSVPTDEVNNLNNVIVNFINSIECNTIKNYHPGVLIELDLEPDLQNIVGSSIHLTKTLMNLISNAAEAINDVGSIRLSTKNFCTTTIMDVYERIPSGEYVVLTISDSGSGISPQDMGKIFEPFYTKKEMRRSGTGLGMAVVWGTVKDLKGYIDIKSVPGTGTSIYLYFPVTGKRLPETKEKIPVEEYMGNEKVLIIDDIREQREVASAILEKLGYSVAVASSGEEAVTYLTKNDVDILILDMIMDPGIDGLKTYKRIIEIHPSQAAIIASGYSEDKKVKEAQKLGAGKYIMKPYTMEKLGIAIRAELDK